MIDPLKLEKERIINNYLSSIDLSENTLDIGKIKRDLKLLISEEPAIKLNHSVTELISEGGKETKKISKLESMSVIYSYEKNVGGQYIPIPVELKYIID